MAYFLRQKENYWDVIDDNFNIIGTSNTDEKRLDWIDFGKFEKIFHPKDFTEKIKVEWIKWTKQKPDWSGSVHIKFNGKNEGNALVHDGKLISIEGEKVVQEFIDIYEYSFYWLKQDMFFVPEKTYTLEEMKRMFFNGGDYKTVEEFNYQITKLDKKYEITLKMKNKKPDNSKGKIKILTVKERK